jgi:hypothetical protein
MTRLLFALLLGSVITGCASLGFQTAGESGPVTWHAEDLQIVQRTAAGTKRPVYTFTFVLKETQGTAITFTHMTHTAYTPGVTTGSSKATTGSWELRPHGELRWPFSYYVYCQGLGSCIEPNLAPSYEVVLTGTDTQGQPVRVAATLRLPPNPRAVPKRSIRRIATPSTPQVSPASTVVARVPIQSINNRSFVYALINNKERVRLLLDTGASRTFLTPDVADALGLRITAQMLRRTIRVFGGQEIKVPFVQLAALAVEDAVVKELEVGIYQVHPQEAPLIDGVLGSDFLNHFTVTLDPTASRLQLQSREALPPHQAPTIRAKSGPRFTDPVKKFSVNKFEY